jgi:hypothetical protein
MEKQNPKSTPKIEKKSYGSDKPSPKKPKASTQEPPAPKKK